MTTLLAAEWPWYVAGPLIGLFVPALLVVGNKVFGISGSLIICVWPLLRARWNIFAMTGVGLEYGT